MIQHTHDEINKALEAINSKLENITTHLSSNGGISIVFKDGRIKFTGSLPVKKTGWTALILTLAGSGVGSNLLGWW